MSNQIFNLDKVNIKVKKILEEFSLKLLDNINPLIHSIILYGSACGNDFIEGKSNINILLITKDITLSKFKPILALLEQYGKKGIIAPLIFTVQEIKESTDVFPIEFLDIKESHILLWGEDLFEHLEIKLDNLRLQCEHELKGKIIRLRQSYLGIGKNRKQVEGIITGTLSSFIPIFKNLIRLKNKIPPNSKEEIIKILCQEFKLEQEVLLAILNDIKGDEKIDGKDISIFLEKYLATLTQLANMADKL